MGRKDACSLAFQMAFLVEEEGCPDRLPAGSLAPTRMVQDAGMPEVAPRVERGAGGRETKTKMRRDEDEDSISMSRF